MAIHYSFDELVANLYDFGWSHLYVFVQIAYAKLIVRFKGGPIFLYESKLCKFIQIAIL